MKEIIYLDTPFIHSYLSQKFGGLPTNTSKEFQEQKTETDSTGTTNTKGSSKQIDLSSGEIDLLSLLKSPSAKAFYNANSIKGTSENFTLSMLDSNKELISMQLHDNALTNFEEVICELDTFKEISDSNISSINVGDIVKSNSPFTILDLSDMELLLEDGFVDVLLHDQITELNDKLPTMTENIQKVKKKELEKQKNDLSAQYNHFKKMIQYLKRIMPADAFIYSNAIMAPLNSLHLRESTRMLNFKYGTLPQRTITIIGKVTKINNNKSIANQSKILGSDFFGLNGMGTTILESIGIIQKNSVIITPIAIYFD